MDVDGPGSRGRHPQRRISAVPSRCPVDGRRIARRTLHALSSGASRRRGHGRRLRIVEIGRLRSGGEPLTYAEGAPADAAVLGGSAVALAEAERVRLYASLPPPPPPPPPLQ